MCEKRFKIVPVVYLMLKRDDKILLLRHSYGYHKGLYSLPGGHLEENETLASAAIREGREETGVLVGPKDLPLVHVFHTIDGDNKGRVGCVFVAKKWRGNPRIMEPHLADYLGWFGLKRLPESTVPYIKLILGRIERGYTYSEFGWET